jgi:hypothetical protein
MMEPERLPAIGVLADGPTSPRGFHSQAAVAGGQIAGRPSQGCSSDSRLV